MIDVAPGGERGLILTCAHLFAEGTGRVVIEFPNGQTHGALLVGVDKNADLAALEIAKPSERPAPLDSQFTPTGALLACGFGSSGEYRCVDGQVIGYSEGPGQRSLRMTGAVRPGDSGGGVFDGQGRLTAVVWGESGGVTYASTGRPLAAFLNCVLGSRRVAPAASPPVANEAACPDGRCPLVRPGLLGRAPADSLPAAEGGSGGGVGGGRAGADPIASSRPCDCKDKLAAIAARLEGLERLPPNNGEVSSSPPALGGTARVLATLATAALGISGPTGWGVIAAASVGGWLIGRRRRSRAKALDSRLSTLDTQEATAAADVSFPIERDDREARELLRLSQLEGRDPLQDAVAGRLALDRLDALAEGDADPQHASWADRLRRELRERFNEIAPTKFNTNGECGMRNGG
ncbi:MAG: trypsin-like peptidase domain-containing protein [Pirellulales bacterium]|nr:trypsin-like peptidase domain-containing protein [Pirellulales bacterium]